jgi:hypothetical protein
MPLYYHYFVDEDFGLCYVRVPTGFVLSYWAGKSGRAQ